MMGMFLGYLESGPRERCRQQQGHPARAFIIDVSTNAHTNHFNLQSLRRRRASGKFLT
jgi:hypothetical protein